MEEKASTSSLSFDRQDFERRLTTLGYTFSRDMNTGEPSVKAPGWQRAVRLSSVGYSKERLNRTIYDNRFKDEVYFQRREQPIYRKRQTPLYDLERTMYRAPWMGALAFPFFLMLELLEISIVKQEYGRAPVYPLSPELRTEMKAIQQGIITESTKECLEELEAQRESLKTNILQVQMERRKFTKEEIVVWISKYKYGNINDLDYQKEIIDTFVNSVYVYDDKIVLTYNYKDGSQTLTLQEIESALSSHLTCLCPPYMKNPNSVSSDLFFFMGFGLEQSNRNLSAECCRTVASSH